MSLPPGRNLFSEYPNKYFVETGAWRGDGIHAALSAGFSDIRSIEIDKESIEFCNSRFNLSDLVNSRVKLYYGDSALILYDIIKDIEEPITFWLDAHTQLLEGEVEYPNKFPLLSELLQVGKHKIKTHTIIIDDILHLTHPDVTGWSRESIESWIRLHINARYHFKYIANPVKNNILIAHV